jgi:hypothetical protein
VQQGRRDVPANKRVCILCRRERPVEKMNGAKCADRDRCLAVALEFRGRPRVSKKTLREQFRD